MSPGQPGIHSEADPDLKTNTMVLTTCRNIWNLDTDSSPAKGVLWDPFSPLSAAACFLPTGQMSARSPTCPELFLLCLFSLFLHSLTLSPKERSHLGPLSPLLKDILSEPARCLAGKGIRQETWQLDFDPQNPYDSGKREPSPIAL